MAFFKDSDYRTTATFDALGDGRQTFKGTHARALRKVEPVLEHTVTMKERLDSLAQNYYASPRAWRWVAEANPDVIFPEDLLWNDQPGQENGRERVGDTILIPRRQEID